MRPRRPRPRSSCIPSVSSGQSALPDVTSDPITLAPRETRFFADVTLGTVPAGDGVVGALEWRSDRSAHGLGAHLHIHAHGNLRFLPAGDPDVRVHDAQDGRRRSRARPPDLRHQLGRRELPDEPRRREHLERDAADRGPRHRRRPRRSSAAPGRTRVAPGSLLRLGQILETVGAPLEDGLRITVAIAPGDRRALGRRPRRRLHARQPDPGRVRVRRASDRAPSSSPPDPAFAATAPGPLRPPPTGGSAGSGRP